MATEQKTKFQRQTAKIASVKELLGGEYIIQEGWKPNYVKTSSRHLVRVNLIGFVVDKPTPYQFILDDGTSSILVMDFNQNKKTLSLKVGEPVLLIGRPRQSDDGLFIAAEVVTSSQLKKNPSWIVKRKEDLAEFKKTDVIEKTSSAEILIEEIDESEEEGEIVQPASGQVTGDDVVDFVRKKDSGDGCAIEEIISYFGQEADDVILTLMSMGEVYEIKPGKIKVLE